MARPDGMPDTVSLARNPHMTPANLARLLLLSAIRGASFVFIRIGSPALGPVALMEACVLLAALLALRKEAANA